MTSIRLSLFAIALLALLAACGGTTSGSTPSEPPTAPSTAGGVDVRGTITSVAPAETGSNRLGTILVEGEREPDTQVDKASITITTDTRIVVREGETERPATFDDLQSGLRVEARFDGPVLESYPVQAGAAEVVILP